MKVGVDAFAMGSEGRGMGRFALQLTSTLREEAVLLKPDPGRRPAFPLWEQLHLIGKARRAEVDCLLCPYNTAPLLPFSSIPKIVVVHDLIFMDREMSSSVSRTQNIGRRYRQAVAPIAAKHALQVVTVSDYSRRLLCERLSLNEKKVSVIPNWIGESWFSTICKPARSRYLLTVSGEAPSKNLVGLLRGFALYRRDGGDATLKVVGVKPAWHQHFSGLAQEHGIRDVVEFLPFVTDESLRELYSQAASYVCASLVEGFGIPLLEAMASGVPLSSSFTTSLPEVAGEAACYFHPLDCEQMAESLAEALSGSSASRARVVKGRERAWTFRRAAVEPLIRAFWQSMESACE